MFNIIIVTINIIIITVIIILLSLLLFEQTSTSHFSKEDQCLPQTIFFVFSPQLHKLLETKENGASDHSRTLF